MSARDYDYRGSPQERQDAAQFAELFAPWREPPVRNHHPTTRCRCGCGGESAEEARAASEPWHFSLSVKDPESVPAGQGLLRSEYRLCIDCDAPWYVTRSAAMRLPDGRWSVGCDFCDDREVIVATADLSREIRCACCTLPEHGRELAAHDSDRDEREVTHAA